MAKLILEIYQASTVQRAEFDDVARLVVGRIHSAEIRVDHPDLANVHCVIEVDHKQKSIHIIDVSGPERGILVNEQQMAEYILTPRDRVRIGPIEFSLFFESDVDQISASSAVKVTIQAPDKAAKAPPPPKPTEEKEAAPPPPPPPPKPTEEKEAAPPPPPPPTDKKEAPPPTPGPEDKKAPEPPLEAVPQPKPKPEPVQEPARSMTLDEGTTVTITAPIARTTLTGDVVEVTEIIGNEVLDVVTFDPGRKITIGEGLKANFTIPMDGFAQKGPVNFIECHRIGMIVHIDQSRMRGMIRTKGKTYTIQRAMQEGVLKKGGPLGTYAELNSEDYCKISVGPVTFFIIKVPKPDKPKSMSLIDWDPVLKRVTFITLIIWLASFLGVAFVPVTPGIVAQRAAERVFQRVLVKKDPVIREEIIRRFRVTEPTEVAVVTPTPAPKPDVGDVGEGVPAIGEEGIRGRVDLPPDKPGVTAKRKQERAVVSPTQQGLLGVITTTDVGAELTTLVSRGGVVDETLVGVGGRRFEDGGGTAGQGLRGTGLGGGGEIAHVGGLGTRGRGAGEVGYGEGAVLGREVGDVLSIGDDQVIEGQLTKEEIRRVVLANMAELRGCYQLQLSRYPELSGEAVLAWLIRPNGRVERARAVQSSWRFVRGPVSLAPLDECLLSKLRTWQFPEPRGGGYVEVKHFPFNFGTQ